MKKTVTAVLMLFSVLLCSCAGVKYALGNPEYLNNDSCVKLYNENKDDFQMVVEDILGDTNGNITQITPYTDLIQSWSSRKQINGVYWAANADEVSFDTGYAGDVSDFIRETGVMEIYVYREEKCVEFLLGSSLTFSKLLVYSTTGEETPDKYTHKIKDLGDGFYLAEANDAERSDTAE